MKKYYDPYKMKRYYDPETWVKRNEIQNKNKFRKKNIEKKLNFCFLYKNFQNQLINLENIYSIQVSNLYKEMNSLIEINKKLLKELQCKAEENGSTLE